jgi:hypothetical protein
MHQIRLHVYKMLALAARSGGSGAGKQIEHPGEVVTGRRFAKSFGPMTRSSSSTIALTPPSKSCDWRSGTRRTNRSMWRRWHVAASGSSAMLM